MARVLAISGLHIGLLYFGLFGVTRLIATMKTSVWENESFVAISRWFPLLLLWGYVFLLEFSNPAQRAVTMITLWLLFRELDYRLPALFALWVKASLFLVLDWRLLLTVSFQLSFVAVAFLVRVVIQEFWKYMAYPSGYWIALSSQPLFRWGHSQSC